MPEGPNPRDRVWRPVVAVALLTLVGLLLYVLNQASEPAEPVEPLPETAVDLLKIVDPARNSARGRFARQGAGLLTPANETWARVQIPYVPPEEYELSAIVERRSGSNSLNLGLSTGTRQFMIVLDGAGPDGPDVSGIDFVGGKPFFDNETSWNGPVFPDRKRIPVHVSVRKAGVEVTVNGRRLLTWKGKYEDLVIAEGWQVPAPNALILGSYDSQFLIHRMWLLPVSGEGKRLPN